MDGYFNVIVLRGVLRFIWLVDSITIETTDYFALMVFWSKTWYNEITGENFV